MLRKQAALARCGFLDDRKKSFCLFPTSCSQFVVSAFSSEQGPRTTYPSAVKGRTILVLAVTIAVVAVPAGSLRQLHPEQGVNGFDGVKDSGIIGSPESEAHQRQ